MIYHDLSSFSLLKSYVGAKSVSCSQADKKNACWFHIPFYNWFLFCFLLSPYQPALTSARPTAGMGSLGMEKPDQRDQICQRTVVQNQVTLSSGLILTCSFKIKQQIQKIGLGWVREWKALYDQAPKMCGPNKKSQCIRWNSPVVLAQNYSSPLFGIPVHGAI